jgi:hypothetical protein
MKNEKRKTKVSPTNLYKVDEWEHLRSLLHKFNTTVSPQEMDDGLNIFLIQNKGKGPPGRARSPELDEGPKPDHPPDFIPLGFQIPERIIDQTNKRLFFKRLNFKCKLVIVQWSDQPFENSINTEYQINNSFLNFSQLNFLS